MNTLQKRGIEFINLNINGKVVKTTNGKDGDMGFILSLTDLEQELDEIISDVDLAINGKFDLIEDTDLSNKYGDVAFITKNGIEYLGHDYDSPNWGKPISPSCSLEDFKDLLVSWKIFLRTPPFDGDIYQTMSSNFSKFKHQLTNPIKYRLFMLSKLPMGFVSGLRIVQLEEAGASVSVKFKWVNQNPFRSIYFAVLSMAAELSTGALAFGQIYQRQPSVSMLVVKMEAEFYKKAVGKIVFTCNDGAAIATAIQQSIDTSQGISVPCTSIGVNEQGEQVAKFVFVWSFKAKST